MTYQLSVQRIQDTCQFELTWERGRRLRAKVHYPVQLNYCYQQWQYAYLGFYKQALRGRVGAVGQVKTTNPDLHSHLVQAEAQLLSEFHRWLQHAELADIRKTLSLAARDTTIDLFLTCDPIETARLPWETWQIGADVGGAPIRIARSPNNIWVAPTAPAASRRKTRVLIILGDDTGLDFEGDRRTLNSLKSQLDLTFISWEPGKDKTALKQEICQAIADPIGWDVLLFIGHSNESDTVSGLIYVAPQTALSVRELRPYLETAQANGLQFALFNSCSGLTIADALIEIGLSQVAVMREPIHNQVAQSFLVQFLQSLVAHCDVHDALQSACRHLKLAQDLTYPSAYLVPTLFRHPDSIPFRIEPRGWRQVIQRWVPSTPQAIALGVFTLLSVLPGVQESLLASRLLSQAIYRNLTGQMPTEAPAVVLVQIDEASRRNTPELANISPINQGYLAQLVDALTELEAGVIGIDYLLDLPQPAHAPTLARSVQRAVDQTSLWLVFSAILENGQEVGVHPDSQIIDPAWAMEGYTNAPHWYLALPWGEDLCQDTCSFPFLLALTAYHQDQAAAFPSPSLDRQRPLRDDLIAAIAASDDPKLTALAQRRISTITALGRLFKQRWLHPILDFSLPPDRVFYRVSAYELLADRVDTETAGAIANASVVLIGGVGYIEGGVDPFLTDISPNPPAVAYWRRWGRDRSREKTFAGVEAMAYNVHHHLQPHLVTPIPALWLMGIAALVSPAIAHYGLPKLKRRQQRILLLGCATLGYGCIGLQLTIGTGVLLPWLLPSITVWIYTLPNIWRLSKP